MKYLHTMVRVKDLDASLRFYCDGLGFEPADTLQYGRVIAGADGTIEKMVEHKDASEAERAHPERQQRALPRWPRGSSPSGRWWSCRW